VHYRCLLLLYNTTTKEDDDTLPLFSSSQTQRRQNTHKNNKKNQEKGGNLLSNSHSALSLLVPAFNLIFQKKILSIFFFSKKRKEKKTIEKKRNAKKEEVFLQTPTLPSHFWLPFCLPIFSLLFQTFSPCIFFFSSRRKKKHKEKKSKEKKELSFKLSFCPLTFGSHFCPPTSTLLFQTFSPGIFFFSRKTQRKRNLKKENKCREGKEISFKLSLYPLIFGSRFCPLTSSLLFQTFFHGIFFFSSKKKNKEENHREEKKCKEGRELRERKELTFKLSLCPLTFGFCFYPHVYAFSFQALSPWHLFLLK
jgi:hypothetical protein